MAGCGGFESHRILHGFYLLFSVSVTDTVNYRSLTVNWKFCRWRACVVYDSRRCHDDIRRFIARPEVAQTGTNHGACAVGLLTVRFIGRSVQLNRIHQAAGWVGCDAVWSWDSCRWSNWPLTAGDELRRSLDDVGPTRCFIARREFAIQAKVKSQTLHCTHAVSLHFTILLGFFAF